MEGEGEGFSKIHPPPLYLLTRSVGILPPEKRKPEGGEIKEKKGQALFAQIPLVGGEINEEKKKSKDLPYFSPHSLLFFLDNERNGGKAKGKKGGRRNAPLGLDSFFLFYYPRREKRGEKIREERGKEEEIKATPRRQSFSFHNVSCEMERIKKNRKTGGLLSGRAWGGKEGGRKERGGGGKNTIIHQVLLQSDAAPRCSKGKGNE